jgi:putative membrane protein
MTPETAGAVSPWEFHLHADVVAFVGVLLLGYFYAIRRYGPIFHPRPDDPPATRKHKTLFVGGLVVYYLAVGWPLHDIAENYLYSAHMVQHILIGYVAPPLLLLGTPEWLGRMLVGRGLAGRAYHRLTHPVVAAVVFNATVAFIHWPQAVGWMLGSEIVHIAIHLVYFLAALLMWSVLYSPLPEIAERLAVPVKMLYLFVQTLVPTVPASFLTFGETPLYAAYTEMPRLFGLSPLADMQLAGLIKKIGLGLFLWGIIAVMFFRWASREGAIGPDRPVRVGGPPGTPSTPLETDA